jgi:phosphoribosylanthranilate isomerase
MPAGDDRGSARRRERTRIKFCGLARAQDVDAAVHLGADFLGFVFAIGSRRGLDLRDAERMLADRDTGEARRVGVFQDQPAKFVNEVVRRCRLDLVQLHGHEPRDYARALEVPAITVLRVPAMGSAARAGAAIEARAPADRKAKRLASASLAAEVPERVALAPNVFAALTDAEDSGGRSGGLGLQARDEDVRRLLGTLTAGTRIFVSGGLTPENVAAAVAAHQPYAVDVSSGIESEPGVKDPGKMRAFLHAVVGTA